MAEESNLRYYIKCHGTLEILIELAANGELGPQSWNKLVKEALRAGDTDIAKYMITNHIQDQFLNGLLLLAAAVDNLEIINLLLDKGADINAVVDGRTALLEAVSCTGSKAVELLLSRSADPNAPTESGPVLHRAISLRNRTAVEALLKHGASVTAEPESTLQRAVRARDWNIIQQILRKSPEDSDIGRSLDYKWVPQIDKLLKMFKKLGQKVTVFPGDNQNCMYRAIRDNNLRELSKLLKHRDVKMVDKGDRLTALHVACFWKREAMVEVLLSCGADAFAKDMCAATPIDYVILNKDLSMLRVFLKMGITFNEHSEMLFQAIAEELSCFVECMIEYGADIHVRDDLGYTPLHMAIDMGHGKCVRVLLDAGADPNAVSYHAGTALHSVTVNEHTLTALCNLLLDYGADINIVDGKNRTAYQVSASYRGRKNYREFSEHITKLVKAEMFLNAANMHIWAEDSFNHTSEGEMAMKCEREIAMMKSERVDGIRIHDILRASENRLARLCKNERIQDFVNSDELAKYNIYGEMIKGRLNLGRIRRKCIEENWFFNYLKSILPIICVDKILGYLSNDDLRMLNKVWTETENSL